MRVVWLGHHSTTVADGLMTYSRQTVRGLRERDVDVLFVRHSQDPGASGSVILPSVTMAHRVGIAPPKARRQLAGLISSPAADVVHVSLGFSSLDFALPRLCRRLGVPLVATFHVPFDRRWSLWTPLSMGTYRLYAPMLAECDAVVIFSEAQRQVLLDLGVPDSVLHVLPNGVDTRRYRPGSSDARRRFGATRLFSYVGRLDPEKNVAALIRAFLAAGPPPGLKLVVVGDGRLRRQLERRFDDPHVIFTGLIGDERARIDILRGSDAFFLPSRVEGLSLAMLEAMACGAATVATDVGGDGEALRGAGIVLDPSHLRRELSSAVRLLTHTPDTCVLLGEEARRRAVERFSLETNLDRLVGLYQRLASSAGRAPLAAGVRPRGARGARDD
jgi:glycosyltransferase involved in cell wall biosynthesis